MLKERLMEVKGISQEEAANIASDMVQRVLNGEEVADVIDSEGLTADDDEHLDTLVQEAREENAKNGDENTAVPVVEETVAEEPAVEVEEAAISPAETTVEEGVEPVESVTEPVGEVPGASPEETTVEEVPVEEVPVEETETQPETPADNPAEEEPVV